MNNSYIKETNYGISILRVLLAFMVVIDHFYNKEVKKKFKHLLYFHIPTFFLLSFYFTYNSFCTFNISKIKARFERLLIPYISWNIIAFILNNIYFYYFKKICPHSYKDFFRGLLGGKIFIVALWFQNVLIFSTLVVSIVVFSFKEIYVLIFHFLMIISYISQYSEFNYYFFTRKFSINYSTTFGRFLDTFPHSLTGFFLGAFKIPNKLKYNKFRAIIISLIVILLLSKYKFDKKILSFKYAGIRLNLASISLFLIFFLSLEKVTSKKMKKFLNIITNYTAGIYFIHWKLGTGYIMKIILGNKINTLFGSSIVYLISYSLCFCLDKLIGNSKFKHMIK